MIYRNQLVLDNLFLIRQEMQKLQIPPGWYDDYYQEGAIGLIEAAKKADTKRINKFSAYARKHIRGKLLAINLGLIYIPRNVRAASRLTNPKEIKEVAGDKRNFHTEKSLKAAQSTMVSQTFEYDPVRDPGQCVEQERIELAEMLENLQETLNELEKRAVEAFVTGEKALAELDREYGTTRNAHSHALCKVKSKLSEIRIF